MAKPLHGLAAVCSILILVTGESHSDHADLRDAAVLVQEGQQAYHVQKAEQIAELYDGLLSLVRHSLAPKAKTAMTEKFANRAGCFKRDAKSFRHHLMQLLPTVEHGILSWMVPRMVSRSTGDDAKEDPQAMAKAAAADVLRPLHDEVTPVECDQKMIKKKIMAQALGGASDAEQVTSACILKATHVSPGCALCAANFLHGFMGRGMVGFASSCVPKCMPAQSACKRGLSDQCLTKSLPCLKCVKPRLLELSDCVGLNNTRLGVSNKVDLFIKAIREGNLKDAGGTEKFVGDIVLALNA